MTETPVHAIRTVIVGEVKKSKTAINDAEKGQVLESARVLLNEQPRPFVYGYVASNKSVVIMRIGLTTRLVDSVSWRTVPSA